MDSQRSNTAGVWRYRGIVRRGIDGDGDENSITYLYNHSVYYCQVAVVVVVGLQSFSLWSMDKDGQGPVE